MEVENPLLIEKGEWTPECVVIQVVRGREILEIATVDQESISKNWDGILAKNPKAFAGPTLRLMQSHPTLDGKKLILEVAPSDYREGCLVNFLGVAMVSVTSDGYVALQAPVAGIAPIIGGGIRVPGCTPPHPDIFSHIVKEMREEFNVDIGQNQLTVLGLVRLRPPLARWHYGLIVKVLLSETFDELKDRWKNAEDKWEGELLPFYLTGGNIEKIAGDERYHCVTTMALSLIAESEKV